MSTNAMPWTRYAQPAQADAKPWEKYGTSSDIGPGATEHSAPPPPKATIGPAPTGIVQTLTDAENDLRGGGGRTMLGRALGHLQGRGEKGYSGLESGTSPETANFMGSVPLGLTKAAKGFAETQDLQPWTGLKDMASGGMQALTIPASFVAPEAADAAIDMVPSASRAGKVFQDIREQAKDVPIQFTKTAPELQRFYELTQRGGRNSKPFTQLYKRLNEEGAASPVTPKDVTSALTAKQRLALPAPMQDIPLGEAPYKPGRLSKPVILESNRATPREFPGYGVNPPARTAPPGEIPGEAGPFPEEQPPWGERFNGMRAHEYVGEKPGTFGGGEPPGVLRRPSQFPESEGPSPVSRLMERLRTQNPVNFPEGRDFYSNISDAAHQTPLQKIMGRGMKPTMRRQAVNVRRAFNDDLTSAADQVGRGQDYTDAMKEYANAKRLEKIGKGALLLGAGEAARRTGLLGNWIHRTALQQ